MIRVWTIFETEMDERRNDGLAFFIGPRAFAHQSDDQSARYC
jgi:hypothetical protein